uniref:caspase family protein n=1 Tax=uncultured Bacteroides sp. TaxID=162156 RepID=UPI002612609B
ANENYLEETPVQYALNDGQTFKTYCQKVLGLPEDNIHYTEDATLNMILTEVDWIAKVAKAYNGEASLIVYYAGHGIPDEASGSSYLLPVDGIGNNLRTGYSLAELYKTLGTLPARSVTVFMDACFSGAKRGEGMLASARGVAIKAKPEAPKGNMVVFSAAQGDETAYPYEDKGHGLFTYFLLKKLQETKGQVSLGELAQYVQQQVSRRSIVTNGKSQTPCVTPSESVIGTWKGKMLK